jgi:hypothetical protein
MVRHKNMDNVKIVYNFINMPSPRSFKSYYSLFAKLVMLMGRVGDRSLEVIRMRKQRSQDG